MRNLHPEFGYAGSTSRLLRRLGTVLVFTVFGLVAGVIGVAVFVAAPDPDPMRAMALAPPQDLGGATTSPKAKAAIAATLSTDAETGLECRENVAPQPGNCNLARARKPGPVRALNERPSIAAIAIGHSNSPVPLKQEMPVIHTAAKPQGAAVAGSAEALSEPQAKASAVEPAAAAPPPSAPPARVRSKIAQHRDDGKRDDARRDDGKHVHARERREHESSPWRSYSYANQQGGYARLW